jgi:hypothetical protein
MALNNKTILILSPQSWGKMFLSKHHYAVELAKYGNKVYFLNPPHFNKELPAISLKADDQVPNLTIIDHRISFPFALKFHWISLFHFLMRSQVKKILRTIGEPIDIVWSFDLGHLYPFSLFPEKSLKVFHPVDEPLTETAINAAKGAQVIFSVTTEILDKYKHHSVPRHFVNHGLSAEFIKSYKPGWQKSSPLRIGLAGNWMRPDIDTTCLLQVITENPGVRFEFWGSYKQTDSNLGGSDNPAIDNFLQQLQKASNVVLHGPVPVEKLAIDLQHLDGFLICYDVQKDQSKGTNYHKVMEYLSTGKVIISNNITTYSREEGLVEMINERNNNTSLPALFNSIIKDIDRYNAEPLRNKRHAFALDNTYSKQVERIELILNSKK